MADGWVDEWVDEWLDSEDLSDFEREVAQVLVSLGPGEITTYGEVALEAGHPGAARAVGSFLSRAPSGVFPWWRVVPASGRLVSGAPHEQAELLRAEGVEVTGDRVRPMA